MDVSIKAIISGFSEALSGFSSLDGATKELATSTKELSEDQKRLNENYARSEEVVARKAQKLQELKDHTAELVKKFQEQHAAEEALHGIGNKIVDMLVGKITKYASLGGAVTALVTVYNQAAAAEKESLETGLRLEAMLKATGSTAGFTKKELDGMADALAKATRFDDESLKNGMSLMLSFGNVQGDTFTRASRLATDYAELMKVDVVGAFRLVGRALEDPVQGMGALSRAIGHLDPEQKKMIKNLQDTGDVIGAQNALLDILEGKFGGLAATLGGESVTASDRLAKSWNELMEELGRSASITEKTGSAMDWLAGKFDSLASSESFKTIIWGMSEIFAPSGGYSLWKTKPKDKSGMTDEEREDAEWAAQFEARIARDEKLVARMVAARDSAKKTRPGRAEDPDKTLQKEFESAEKFFLGLHELGEKSQQDIEDFYSEWEQIAEDSGPVLQEVRLKYSRFLKKTLDDEDKDNKDFQAEQERLLKNWENVEKRYYRDASIQMALAQREEKEAARDAIYDIKQIVGLTRDEYIEELKRLERQFELAGYSGQTALKLVRDELRHSKTDAQTLSDGLVKMFTTDVPKSILATVGSIKGSLSSSIYDVISGSKDLGDSLKSFFDSVTKTILKSLADIAANEIMKWLFSGGDKGIGSGFLSSLTSGLDSFFGSITTGVDGIFGNLLSKLASSATSFLGWIWDGVSGLFSGSSTGTGGGAGLFSGLFSGTTTPAIDYGLAGGTGAGWTGGGSEFLSGDSLFSGLFEGVAEGGFFSTIGAALPWVGGALGIGSLFGLFDDDEPQRPTLTTTTSGRGGPVGTLAVTADNGMNMTVADAEAANAIIAGWPVLVREAMDGFTVELAPGGTALEAWAIIRARANEAANTLGLTMDDKRSYATGTDMIVTRPTTFVAGESGAERVEVSPLAGSRGRGAATIVFNGPAMFDEYTFRRFKWMMQQ